MNELAKALLALSWSDMDDFATFLTDVHYDVGVTEDSARVISQSLVDWAKVVAENE